MTATTDAASYDVVLQSDVAQTMRDGTTLYADVYLPGRDGVPLETSWPTVLA